MDNEKLTATPIDAAAPEAEEHILVRRRTMIQCMAEACHFAASAKMSLLRKAWIPAIVYGVCTVIVVWLSLTSFTELGVKAQYELLPLEYMQSFAGAALLFAAAGVAGGLAELAFYASGVAVLCGAYIERDTARPRWLAFSWRGFWRMIKSVLFSCLTILPLVILLVLVGWAGVQAKLIAEAWQYAFCISLSIIAIVVAAVPLNVVAARYLLHTDKSWLQILKSDYRRLLTRYFGKIFATLLSAGLAIGLAFILLSIPYMILSSALASAHAGLGMGDEVSYPSYVPALFAALTFVYAVMQLVARLILIYVSCLLSGSIAKREQERA